MSAPFDLCGSLGGAGELAGVSHHTAARYVPPPPHDASELPGELAGDGPRCRGGRARPSKTDVSADAGLSARNAITPS